MLYTFSVAHIGATAFGIMGSQVSGESCHSHRNCKDSTKGVGLLAPSSCRYRRFCRSALAKITAYQACARLGQCINKRLTKSYRPLMDGRVADGQEVKAASIGRLPKYSGLPLANEQRRVRSKCAASKGLLDGTTQSFEWLYKLSPPLEGRQSCRRTHPCSRVPGHQMCQ